MATQELDTKGSVDEKTFSPTSEHLADSIDGSDADADEALKLVGKERTTEFSDEFNRKVRRKLVSLLDDWKQ